jgi:hypothetical protein
MIEENPHHNEAARGAFAHGMSYAGKVGVFSIGAVLAATKFSPTFVKRTNTGSRTAIAIMPMMLAFGLNSMLELGRTARHNTDHLARK